MALDDLSASDLVHDLADKTVVFVTLVQGLAVVCLDLHRNISLDGAVYWVGCVACSFLHYGMVR